MATNDPYAQEISIAALSDAPSAQTLAQNIVNGITPHVVLWFTSASERAATLVGAYAATEGMVTWLQDANRLDVYDGTGWRQINTTTVSRAVSDQVSMPGSFSTSGFTDFTSGQWPPLTVTVPPSGAVRITIGAAVANTVASNATAWASWRATGALSESGSEKNSVTTIGGRTYASRTVIRSGLSAGSSMTVTPQYNCSASGTVGSVTRISDGQLIVEPLA